MGERLNTEIKSLLVLTMRGDLGSCDEYGKLVLELTGRIEDKERAGEISELEAINLVHRVTKALQKGTLVPKK